MQIIAALELVASVNLPESFFNYLQLLIVTALFIQKATKQEIKQEDAYVLYFLHQRNCYEQGVRSTIRGTKQFQSIQKCAKKAIT